MKKNPLFLALIIILLSVACGPSTEQQATMAATSETATAAEWTMTSIPTSTNTLIPTDTPTSTETPTSTTTPTETLTPTITSTPTKTPSSTFDFPKVTVNKALAACMYGPSVEYLWGLDMKAGDTGLVWGRSPYNDWLYVKMFNLAIPCWVSPYVVDVIGDVNRVMVQQVRLPMANNLYAHPTNVRASRQGDKVTVTWNAVWMTLDDDRGYTIEAWVCQKGKLVWTLVGRTGLPDQYHTSYTFTDQQGCSDPSWGNLYTVEKHGYTNPVTIPWPPYVVTKPPTDTPSVVPSNTPGAVPSNTPGIVPTDMPVPPAADTPTDTPTPGS